MIEIMAIVRPNKTSATKQALININRPGYTCVRAVGRGKKTVEVILSDGKKLKTKLVSKRMFLIVVEDAAKEEVVQAIIDANWSGNEGDGKIFVTKIVDSYNVHLE